MAGTLAQVIQGEAGSDPANQYAVAATIYNRQQAGNFPGGTDLNAIVNAPNQYVGSATPNASANYFANALQNGTFSDLGSPGNATFFQTTGSNTTLGNVGYNIGGNAFSDQFGAPTRNFTPPSYTPDNFSVSDTPGSQANHIITDGVSNGNGDSFSFNDPNSNPSVTSDANNSNYNFFGLNPVSNTDPLANSTTAQDYGSFGLNPLPSSLGDAFNAINPLITGATPSSSSTASGNTFYQGVLNNVKDFIVRFGLILLAIVLIGVAAWGLSSGELKRQYNRLAA